MLPWQRNKTLALIFSRTQQYGWREPYDNLTFGYNKSGICKRTFFDGGHLQWYSDILEIDL